MQRFEGVCALEDLEPGTILFTRKPGGITHYGVLTERGTVISASKVRGKVVEEHPFGFSLGAPIHIAGLRGDQDGWETVEIARSLLGTRYDLFKANCEHFVRYCSGCLPESPQLQNAMGALAVGAVLVGLYLAA